MTRKEFIKAVGLARSESFKPIEYLSEQMSVFSGCAIDNKRRIVSMEEVASLIYAHCATFAGTWDSSGIDELERLSKRFDVTQTKSN
jgi:hypothetical protein